MLFLELFDIAGNGKPKYFQARREFHIGHRHKYSFLCTYNDFLFLIMSFYLDIISKKMSSFMKVRQGWI